MFGKLDHVFADLTKILVQVEGHGDIKDDLSNVTIKFIKGQPLFMVFGKFKEGRGAYHMPNELVEHEERLIKLAKREKERMTEQDIPHYVIANIEGEELCIEKEKFDEATRKGMTWGELLEKLKKKNFEKETKHRLEKKQIGRNNRA